MKDACVSLAGQVVVGRVTPVRATFEIPIGVSRRIGARPTVLRLPAYDPFRYAPGMNLPVRKTLPHSIPQ